MIVQEDNNSYWFTIGGVIKKNTDFFLSACYNDVCGK